jgi:NAD(P)H-flavin reductase
MKAPYAAAIATNPWLAREARIERITPEVDDVQTYHLQFTDPEVQADYRFTAGQFNMLYVPGVGEIAIGVSADPEVAEGERTWDHTIRLAGQVTGALAELSPGMTIGLRGPYGSIWPLTEHHDHDVLLIAGGTGLASLRAALYELLLHRDQYRRVTLLYGSRTPETLLYESEYAQWKRRGLTVHSTVDQATAGWTGHVGVVSRLVDGLRTLDPSRTVIYCCGPEIMMHYVVQSAVARGLLHEQIWVSLERNMQCAVGLCGHCLLGPEFICRDGPVFRFDRVARYLNVESL